MRASLDIGHLDFGCLDVECLDVECLDVECLDVGCLVVFGMISVFVSLVCVLSVSIATKPCEECGKLTRHKCRQCGVPLCKECFRMVRVEGGCT